MMQQAEFSSGKLYESRFRIIPPMNTSQEGETDNTTFSKQLQARLPPLLDVTASVLVER